VRPPGHTDSKSRPAPRFRRNINRAAWPILFVPIALATAVQSDHWPQFLGPTRDGVYLGPIAARWPSDGPALVWKREVGAGFSGPAIQDDKLLLFHRVEDRATVECLESSTGRLLWTAAYPTDYRDDFGFDPGPRATPSIADGRVFTFGAEGHRQNFRHQQGLVRTRVFSSGA
jgi:hypothetical protein